jgi:hypothetical protein
VTDVNRPEGPVPTVCDYTLTHLIRAVERGHDNFVFSSGELQRSFPWVDVHEPCDVGVLAEALGPGWGVRDGMRHVLLRQCDKRVALSTLRRMLGG